MAVFLAVTLAILSNCLGLPSHYFHSQCTSLWPLKGKYELTGIKAYTYKNIAVSNLMPIPVPNFCLQFSPGLIITTLLSGLLPFLTLVGQTAPSSPTPTFFLTTPRFIYCNQLILLYFFLLYLSCILSCWNTFLYMCTVHNRNVH